MTVSVGKAVSSAPNVLPVLKESPRLLLLLSRREERDNKRYLYPHLSLVLLERRYGENIQELGIPFVGDVIFHQRRVDSDALPFELP